ncbi:MAG: hypothetical protein IPP47_18205 [Bryobacterales bacterium]|nr:hypothetical protein [Bryobacterales bacterium]
MPRVLSYFASALLLSAAFWLGGWPWAALWALAFALLARQEGPVQALAAAGPAFFWLALFHWTGDRRLFFPFAMHLAQASSPVLLATAFFAIRIQQFATLHVLTVELLVAAAVLSIGYAGRRQAPPGLSTRVVASAIVAILALAGLLI